MTKLNLAERLNKLSPERRARVLAMAENPNKARDAAWEKKFCRLSPYAPSPEMYLPWTEDEKQRLRAALTVLITPRE